MGPIQAWDQPRIHPPNDCRVLHFEIPGLRHLLSFPNLDALNLLLNDLFVCIILGRGGGRFIYESLRKRHGNWHGGVRWNMVVSATSFQRRLIYPLCTNPARRTGHRRRRYDVSGASTARCGTTTGRVRGIFPKCDPHKRNIHCGRVTTDVSAYPSQQAFYDSIISRNNLGIMVVRIEIIPS